MLNSDSDPRRYFTSTPAFVILAVLFVLFGLDITQYLVYTGQLLKYVYFLVIVLLLGLILVRHSVINVNPAHAFFFLGLCLASATSFFIKIVLNYPQSYASALLPLVVVALMLGVPNHRSYVDFSFMREFLVTTGLIFSTVHVGWQFVTDPNLGSLAFETSSHEKTFVLIFTLCLCLLVKRPAAFLYMCALIAVSMWLRPTSTMVAGIVVALFIAILFRVGANKIGGCVTGVCLAALSLYPLVFVLMPDAASTIVEIERPIKEFFDSRSNYEFRIALMSAARTEFLSDSLWFGKKLIGTPTVDAGTWSTTIHNDFMIMLTQGGLVGYFVLVAALVGVLHCALRGLGLGARMQDEGIITFYQSVCVAMVLISIYISFNPIMQKYSVVYFFWFIFLVSGVGSRNLHVSASDETRSDIDNSASIAAVSGEARAWY